MRLIYTIHYPKWSLALQPEHDMRQRHSRCQAESVREFSASRFCELLFYAHVVTIFLLLWYFLVNPARVYTVGIT